ncbi:Efflux pump rdc3, partial [Colletotrichum shisoi]
MPDNESNDGYSPQFLEKRGRPEFRVVPIGRQTPGRSDLFPGAGERRCGINRQHLPHVEESSTEWVRALRSDPVVVEEEVDTCACGNIHNLRHVSATPTPLASAVYTPALDQVVGDFNIENNLTLANLTVSAYVLGFPAGPLLLAPLSETFGKKPVYQACNVLLLPCNLACMVAPSAEWLIFFRSVAGCAGASPVTQGTGTATDVMTKEKRARAMSVMAFGSVCSPSIGSALGGVMAQVWGWRSCFEFPVLMGSISIFLTHQFMRETYLPVLRRKHAVWSGVGDVNGEISDEKTVALKQPLSSFLYKAAIRPSSLVFEPSILPAIAVMSFFYGLQVWLYIDIPMTYKAVYSFTTTQAGLAFAGMGA